MVNNEYLCGEHERKNIQFEMDIETVHSERYTRNIGGCVELTEQSKTLTLHAHIRPRPFQMW